jgi:hypothetical protein
MAGALGPPPPVRQFGDSQNATLIYLNKLKELAKTLNARQLRELTHVTTLLANSGFDYLLTGPTSKAILTQASAKRERNTKRGRRPKSLSYRSKKVF